MGADTTPAKTVEAPELTPISIPPRLAPTPVGTPKFSVQVPNASGQPVTLADPDATRALVALMDVHAVVGGAACHWGGPAAFAEMMSAVHGIMFSTEGRPWYEAYNFVNDAGHAENGIYALRANYGFDGLTPDDLKGFRSISSKLTGHGESHLNPQGVLLSNGPLGSSLPQAQGLAMADKTARRDRTTLCALSDGAAMEGEAKEALAALPGLAAKGLVNPFLLLLSDNDTKLSGRITEDSFSMQPSFESLATLGWRVTRIDDGHDLPSLFLAVEKALADAQADPTRPVCLWIKTIKGYGVKATAESASGGHGFPLSSGEKIIDFVNEIYGSADRVPAELAQWASSLRADWEKKQQAKASAPAPSSPAPAIKKGKAQAGFSTAAIRAAQEGLPVYSISSDVQGSTGMSAFQKALPDRWVEVGIAESNMISVAAGYSKVGYLPIVDTFGQFGITKGNLPLTMAALSQAPVIAVFSHVGFQDAADGASHQATTYLSATCPIPHTVVISVSCCDEADALMYQALKRMADERAAGRDGESVLFFVGRENFPLSYAENATYEWGKPQILADGGTDVTIVASGSMTGKALASHALLKEAGISATIINHPFINRPDTGIIGDAVRASGGRLITVEDHQAVCGMGSLLVHALVQSGIGVEARSLGIQGEFGQSAYLADELYDRYGLSPQGILATAKEMLRKA